MGYYIIIILFALILGIISKSIKKKKRENTIPLEYDDIIESSNDFVLYLRAFEDDGKQREKLESPVTMAMSSSYTIEEEIAYYFKKHNLIAVGKPNEEFPHLGAKRMYVSDETWKEKVTKLAHKSSLLILKPSFTDGFEWELEMLITEKLLHKTIILHFFKSNEDKVVQKFYYDKLKEKMKNIYDFNLLEFDKHMKYSYFDEGLSHVHVRKLNQIPRYTKLREE